MKQPVTALSSTEAEIYALSATIKAFKLRYWIAEELGHSVEWPVKIQCDNSACIQFQNSTNSDTKLRGVIQLRSDWMQELRSNGIVKAVKVPTDLNLADMLTKCLGYAARSKLSLELARIALDVSARSPVI